MLKEPINPTDSEKIAFALTAAIVEIRMLEALLHRRLPSAACVVTKCEEAITLVK